MYRINTLLYENIYQSQCQSGEIEDPEARLQIKVKHSFDNKSNLVDWDAVGQLATKSRKQKAEPESPAMPLNLGNNRAKSKAGLRPKPRWKHEIAGHRHQETATHLHWDAGELQQG